MGFFGFGHRRATHDNFSSDMPSAPSVNTGSSEGAPTVLNLHKNEILNLSKTNPGLVKVHVAAGWDVKRGVGDYDLDLCACLIDKGGKRLPSNYSVYYGHKKQKGIYLDGDNLTGEGDGDDENIFITLNDLNPAVEKIVFAVVIYCAKERGQTFTGIKNAYVRLCDANNNDLELCRYNLSTDGGNAEGVVFAELYKTNGEWEFKAIGNPFNGSITTFNDMYK